MIEVFLISIGLAMDAFSASLVKGLCLIKDKFKYALIIGGFFGFFQTFMFLLGNMVGDFISGSIVNYGSIIASLILFGIGANMIRETLSEDDEVTDVFDYKELVVLAIATSIDALAVGVSFALINHPYILFSSLVIGIVAFILSLIGVMIGCKINSRYSKMAGFAGGIILILIGIKTIIGIM